MKRRCEKNHHILRIRNGFAFEYTRIHLHTALCLFRNDIKTSKPKRLEQQSFQRQIYTNDTQLKLNIYNTFTSNKYIYNHNAR